MDAQSALRRNMADSPFDRALDFIYSFIDYEKKRDPHIKITWDLRRVELLLEKLGNPHLLAKTVHIAGSKGKGSTAAMVASVLTRAGYATGLYTSPHLHFFNERIRVNDRQITNDEIVAMVAKIRPAVEEVNKEAAFGVLTTFEVTTVMGFYYFAQKKVDIQVIEVGLGGRLDATNVVQPDVCVITPISYEHTDILGKTLTLIATEKSGIIKKGSTVVSSPQPAEADAAIAAACVTQAAKLIHVGKDVTYQITKFDDAQQSFTVRGRLGNYKLTIPLLGEYQLNNAATAVAALEVLIEKGNPVPKRSIVWGMKEVNWEGRLQVLNHRPLVVADGAHNQDSAQKLRQALAQYFKFEKAVLIIGMSSDKDLAGIVAELAPVFRQVIVTKSLHPRAMDTRPIAEEFLKYGIIARQTEDIAIAMPLGLTLTGENDLLCITGSLFIAAGAIEQIMALGLKPGKGEK
jgi:dihydrofolate synthase/folylpolyglutamate synthase